MSLLKPDETKLFLPSRSQFQFVILSNRQRCPRGAWFRGITFASHCCVFNCERSGVRFPECPFLVPAAKIQNHTDIRFFSIVGLALPELVLPVISKLQGISTLERYSVRVGCAGFCLIMHVIVDSPQFPTACELAVLLLSILSSPYMGDTKRLGAIVYACRSTFDLLNVKLCGNPF